MADDVPYADLIAREQIKALSLRLTEQMTAQTTANKIALDAAEKAVLKAEQASEKRFEGVNEFRQTLSDQAATFITRKEVEALLLATNSNIHRLEAQAAGREGRSGISTALLVGLTVGASSLITYFLTHPAGVAAH